MTKPFKIIQIMLVPLAASTFITAQNSEGVSESNWVQTNPNEVWFQILRCYSPSKTFFDKTWQPGKLEIIK